MRMILVSAAVAIVGLFGDVGASQAYDGPWCAVTNVGRAVHENCSMRTLEMCRQEVIAGNRGFCNPNPRWLAAQQGPRRTRRRDD
jgi:hypothetical protein